MTDSDLRIELDSLTKLIRPTLLEAFSENGLGNTLIADLDEKYPADADVSYETLNEELIASVLSYLPGYGGANAALVNRLLIEATKSYGFKAIVEGIGRSTFLI